jgi:carbonic anhydrase
MPTPRTALGGTLLALALVTACAGEQEPAAQGPEPADQAPATETAETAAWSYEGDTGPERWAELDATYATCAAGQRQSPIDVSEARPADTEPQAADPVTYEYTPAPFTLTNEGYTIKASAEDAGGLTLGDERYELLQFHVHAPSEHTLDGQRTDLGVHLVHQNAGGELAVVQLFFEPGSAEGVLGEAFADLPSEEGETTTVEDFDVSALLPEGRTTFRYDGSLTTPPCTENVRWIVMQEAMQGSAEVISAIQDVIGETARPLQPLNGREVVVAQD